MVGCWGLSRQLFGRVQQNKQVSFDIVAAFICFLALCLSSVAMAQNLDDVHVEPREQTVTAEHRRTQVAGALLSEPALLNVQVDVVLVPVVVTDAANRPVMGLKKENFAIYDAEQKQQIRY